jgi:hypothetical protein
MGYHFLAVFTAVVSSVGATPLGMIPVAWLTTREPRSEAGL